MGKKIFKLYGYDIVEKEAKRYGNTTLLILPKTWLGKKVEVILLEDPDKKEDN